MRPLTLSSASSLRWGIDSASAKSRQIRLMSTGLSDGLLGDPESEPLSKATVPTLGDGGQRVAVVKLFS